MFPQKKLWVSKPVGILFDGDEKSEGYFSFLKKMCYSVDQTLSAAYNLRFGHIMNDLTTLLQPKDVSQYMSKISQMQQLSPASGFDASTPADVVYRSITPANCQTPSELQHFSRIYADKIQPELLKHTKQNPTKPENKIDFTENKTE